MATAETVKQSKSSRLLAEGEVARAIEEGYAEMRSDAVQGAGQSLLTVALSHFGQGALAAAAAIVLLPALVFGGLTAAGLMQGVPTPVDPVSMAGVGLSTGAQMLLNPLGLLGMAGAGAVYAGLEDKKQRDAVEAALARAEERAQESALRLETLQKEQEEAPQFDMAEDEKPRRRFAHDGLKRGNPLQPTQKTGEAHVIR